MKRGVLALFAAAAICALSAAPVLANNGVGWGVGGTPPGHAYGKGTPGPLAAAGLPFLLVMGAAGLYRVVRRRSENRRTRREQGD